jgi:hypothetical protein
MNETVLCISGGGSFEHLLAELREQFPDTRCYGGHERQLVAASVAATAGTLLFFSLPPNASRTLGEFEAALVAVEKQYGVCRAGICELMTGLIHYPHLVASVMNGTCQLLAPATLLGKEVPMFTHNMETPPNLLLIMRMLGPPWSEKHVFAFVRRER